ncbi:MAG TPA: nitrilase-related carbon-nitrogen hydrolase [Candidatus Eremiobacteraceae bacterium]|nr:nitrilase-related carbon-nitrogen hydrolase [Candidatus Eremiobacteraceae bacterium]
MAKRVSRVTVRIACAQLVARPTAHARAALTDILAAVAAAGAESADFLVLPECAYPGYVLLAVDPYRKYRIPSAAQALAAVGDAARRASVNVIVGIARTGPAGALRNEAVLIDRSGAISGVYAKSHLWNFDRRWFERGDELPVFETDCGRIGLMICADGRVPEIARTLAKRGAWLIADPTAWVGVGPSYADIHNPQVEFALRTRALENGVAIAAADKCGSETGAVHYAGRSMILSADGRTKAQAPADGAAFIVADVVRHAPRPLVTSVSRSQAKILRAPARRNTAAGNAALPSRSVTIGVYQSRKGGKGFGERREAYASLRAQGAEIIVDTTARAGDIAAALRGARGVRCSIIEGRDMFAPEPARADALAGADIIAWVRPPRTDSIRDFARTRAFENRVFVLVCASAGDNEPACVIAPDGAVAAEALAHVPSGYTFEIRVDRARDKSVVARTDAFADRTPAAYELFL